MQLTSTPLEFMLIAYLMVTECGKNGKLGFVKNERRMLEEERRL